MFLYAWVDTIYEGRNYILSTTVCLMTLDFILRFQVVSYLDLVVQGLEWRYGFNMQFT